MLSCYLLVIDSKGYLVFAVFSKLRATKGLMAGVLLGGTLGSFGVAAATSTPSTTVFYACLNVKAGPMNSINTTGAPKCAKGNVNTSWNAIGPKGDSGNQGVAGQQGVPGNRGLQGLTGDMGPQGPKGDAGTAASPALVWKVPVFWTFNGGIGDVTMHVPKGLWSINGCTITTADTTVTRFESLYDVTNESGSEFLASCYDWFNGNRANSHPWLVTAIPYALGQ